jgi:CRISPR-associated exonuclease Cas4
MSVIRNNLINVEAMHITGTHFNYYIICHHKLWLFANHIQMEQNSDLVYEGKLIHETTYQRRSEKYTELEIDGIKIDFYDPRSKIIHEVKKSDKKEDAHIWQVKYYIYILEKNGITGATAILEYPKLRRREEIFLSTIDKEEIQEMEKDIREIINTGDAPGKLAKSKCRNCAYFDFCWADEMNETLK